MSAAAPAARPVGGGSVGASAARFVRRNAWVLGLWGLLALVLVFTKVIQPNYGAAAFGVLVLATLPYAFATAGQALVVIGGGIDLSMAAMMAFTSVTAAALMEPVTGIFAGEEAGILAVIAVLALGLVIGAINGTAVVLTRVPDIVVTLAFFFIWEGAALLVLDAPGGGAATWLKQLTIGTVGTDLIPAEISQWLYRGLIVLVVALGVVWIPLRRSRLGLSIYAIGSNPLAAFRSGVAVNRTKVAAYALGGLFAAMGGLILTMSTGIGTPSQGPYLLASVAAVVLGGVSLAGGRGGLVGPIVAVFILRLVRQDLTLLSVDPNIAQVVEGLIMVFVVLLGAVLALRGNRT